MIKGAEKFGGQTVSKLMEVEMQILSNAKCEEKYTNMFDSKSQICAGEFSANSGACQV